MADSPESKIASRELHRSRRILRACRIGVLLLFAAAVALLLWCNLVGVPRWVTTHIQEELRQRNIHLEFAKLRLKGFTRLVASNVHLESAIDTNSPVFAAREAEFLVEFSRLRHGEFRLSGVRLVAGNLLLPVDPQRDRALTVSNITADVLLLPDDTLRVTDFSAETLGARATLNGELQRFSRFKFATSEQPGAAPNWQRPLAQVLDIARQLRFENPPELSVSLLADGGDLPSARASVILRSGEASSRWGRFDHLEISSSLAPAQSNNAVRGNFASRIDGFQSDYGTLNSFTLEGETLWARNMQLLLTNSIRLTADNLNSRWLRSARTAAELASSQRSTNSPIASTLSFTATSLRSLSFSVETNVLGAALQHPLPFPTPAAWLARFFEAYPRGVQTESISNLLSGQWHSESTGVQAGRADLGTVQLRGSVLVTTNQSSDASLGFWRFLAGVETPWQAQITNIRAGDITIGSLQAAGDWGFPLLSLTELNARLHGGTLRASGALDVTTRQLSGQTSANFNYDRIGVLFDTPVQNWLSQFTWEKPPLLQSVLRFRLPPWTNWSSQARSSIATTLELSGRFEGAGQFRGIPLDAASSHFQFSNFVWRLPNLLVRRGEGEARLDYTGNVTNADFACSVESRIDPAVLKPLFPPEQQIALNMVKFVQPPLIRAKLAGNWEDPSKLGVSASLAATNFFVKEQAFTDLAGTILITNGLIHCRDVIAHRGKEEARAPYLRIDLPGEVMLVTNLVSTIDPWIAMSLVGEDAYNAIDPYRFASTPTVGVNGIVPLKHWSKADLHFDVAGNDFSFWRFHLPNLAGHVHWRANEVTFSNVVAGFYGGKANWSGRFVIDPRPGEDYAVFSFAGTTTNTDIGPLVADLTRRTNRMEGTLHGHLVITEAKTSDDRSWAGHGAAKIENGYLWSTPLFGIFTPILDGIAPGLGTSPITSGSGSFTIDKSVVTTRDMQVRAPAFRLAYKGTVDLDGSLDATAEAMIFRDAWVFGKLFSTVLWPVSKAFEANISGTLDAPKTQLRYVPKFVLAPFRALNALGNSARKTPAQNSLQPPENAANPSGEAVKP